MPWLIRCGTALMAIALFASCGRNEPPWNKLPSAGDQPYEVRIRTYRDGDYADQPFHLRVISRGSRQSEIRVMAARQCKNVNILQENGFLYLFYEELSLGGFSSSQYNVAMPRPFLCPLQHEFCRVSLRQFPNFPITVSPLIWRSPLTLPSIPGTIPGTRTIPGTQTIPGTPQTIPGTQQFRGHQFRGHNTN